MVYRESLKLQSRDRAVSFHDVTQQVKEIAAKSGMKNGICVVYSHHTTCSVITQECAFDMSMTGLETLQQDFLCKPYQPSCFFRWSAARRVAAIIIGRNVTIVMEDGELDLGEFGRVHFIDWDQTRARKRTVQVMLIGE